MDSNYSLPKRNTMESTAEFAERYFNVEEQNDLVPEMSSMPNISARSTLEFSTVNQAPHSVSTSPYLPHLAIYDHLPRNTDIFSDTSKYQKWATMVLPRIASPKEMISKKGFAVRLNKDRYDTGISPDVLTMSPLSHRQEKIVVEKTFSPRRRKVRPGLAKGNTTKHKTLIQASQQTNDRHKMKKVKTNMVSPSCEGKDQSIVSSSLGLAFEKMNVASPRMDEMVMRDKTRHMPRILANGYFQKLQELNRHPVTETATRKQQKQFLNFTRPANVRPTKQRHSYMSSIRQDITPSNSYYRGGSFPKPGGRTTSCLSITLSNNKKEKTIPSFSDLNKSFSEDLGQCVTAIQVPS